MHAFPEDCELFDDREVIGGLSLAKLYLKYKPTRGGLFVDRENKSEAWAWIDTLGNDLITRKFDQVFVRFPEKEQEYKIEARITQHNFPPEDFEFTVSVKPILEERIEYIYEEHACMIYIVVGIIVCLGAWLFFPEAGDLWRAIIVFLVIFLIVLLLYHRSEGDDAYESLGVKTRF